MKYASLTILAPPGHVLFTLHLCPVPFVWKQTLISQLTNSKHLGYVLAPDEDYCQLLSGGIHYQTPASVKNIVNKVGAFPVLIFITAIYGLRKYFGPS